MNDEQLYAFVADARARLRNDSRRRTRWLERQLREATAFAELCAALAEDASAAEVVLLSDRRVRGSVTIAGTDFVQLTAGDGTRTLLPAAAIVSVRVLGHGDRPLSPTSAALPPAAGQLLDELETLAERRSPVAIATCADAVYRGVIGGVGRDVIWLQHAVEYIRVTMITDITVLP